jgi:hypothetical protein
MKMIVEACRAYSLTATIEGLLDPTKGEAAPLHSLGLTRHESAPASAALDRCRARNYFTTRSVISSPLSMMAKASRICDSLMHSGGFVKNVFHRTKV